MKSLHRFALLVLLVFFTAATTVISQETEGFSDNNGVKTYYRIYGSKGSPLLIINGGPGMNSNGFAELAKHLSANNRAIIFDQRGTGKTHVPAALDSSTITMQNMVNDMEALRKHLGYERWILLGHSFGGLLAAYYSTQYPQRVEKMIFSASGGINLDFLRYVGQSINSRLTKSERDTVAYWSQRYDAGDTSYAGRLRRGMALAPAYVFDKRFVPTIAERLTQGNGLVNALVFADLRRINYDCTEPLRRFKSPVLIIQGKQDIIKPETAEYARKVLPASHMVMLDSCGHYGWLDAEKQYLTVVRSFLTFGLTKSKP
jgi:proline iminopeptidase